MGEGDDKMSEEIKKNGLADEVIAIYSNVS